MIFFIIILITVIAIFLKIKKKLRNLRYDNITFFEGTLGSGKTTLIVNKTIKEFKKRKRQNFFRIPKTIIINVILALIPFYNIWYIYNGIKYKKWFKVKKRGTEIYSNFPIYINKKYGFSKVITKNLLTWKYRVLEDNITALDEVEYLWPSEMKKTDPLYNFCLTWHRHATDSLIFTASQSLSGCNVVFRRKVNRCYHLTNLSKCIIPFFSKVQLHETIISEDIANIKMDNNEDRNENWHLFIYPKGHFESRYAKKLYELPQEEIEKCAVNYEYLLDKMGYKEGDYWKSLYYEFD